MKLRPLAPLFALSLVCNCFAIVPDFQQKLIPSQVLIKYGDGNGFGSGTIISTAPRGDDQIVYVLTADHVIRRGGTLGRLRPNIRVVTNSLAGGKVLNFTGSAWSGGGDKNERKDLAVFAVLNPKANNFDFSNSVATISPFNMDLVCDEVYFTQWGYGLTGSPKYDKDGLWLGYDKNVLDQNLRFENSAFTIETPVFPNEDDNYIFHAIGSNLIRYTKNSPVWFNGAGTTNEGDSGGGVMSAASASDNFTLKTKINPDGVYNGPDDSIKGRQVQIPYYTDVLVAVFSSSTISRFDAFNGHRSLAVPLTQNDLTWIANSCGCTLKQPAPPIRPLAGRTWPSGALAVVAAMCVGLVAGLVIPFRRGP